MNRLVPAIIRQEQRSIESLAQHCSNGLTATVAQAETWLSNHNELRSRYKEKWSTWDAACLAVYKMSRQAVDKRLLKLSEDVSATTVAEIADAIDKKESVALKQVEKAREEEPEKAAVHSADEVKRDQPKPHNNGQNGKPKYQLALWGELETSLGRSLNRADELNRMCPNPTLHSQFLAVTKSCMALLAKWRESVK